jgi:hypothetical protein
VGKATRLPLYFHLTEGEGAQADAQSFHSRLLRREAGRQGLRRVGKSAGISALALSEEPLGQLRPAGEDIGKTGYVDHVDAEPDEATGTDEANGAIPPAARYLRTGDFRTGDLRIDEINEPAPR